jgi:hypothetical protein
MLKIRKIQSIISPYLILNNIKNRINIILNNMINKINNMRSMKIIKIKLAKITNYLLIIIKHFIRLNLISLTLFNEYKFKIKV